MRGSGRSEVLLKYYLLLQAGVRSHYQPWGQWRHCYSIRMILQGVAEDKDFLDVIRTWAQTSKLGHMNIEHICAPLRSHWPQQAHRARHWPIRCVSDIKLGRDGKIRSVIVSNGSNQQDPPRAKPHITRGIRQLYPLESTLLRDQD